MHHTLIHGDCREQLRTLADNSIDSIVCDPPYELGFMGKRWDSTGIAYDLTVWTECLRVLKPGGHLIAFGGTRTYHRMTVAIEDAGFEIRDCIMWLYGCLDEQTRIVTRNGIMQYHKLKIGDSVLCYNIDNKQYQYEKVQEIVIYDYHDTAYRLIGDFGEQVVSRNHRVIVERNGREVFVPAEALQSEERVPILENVHTVSSTISNTQSHPKIAQSSVLKKLRQSKTINNSHWQKEGHICQSCGAVCSLQQNIDALSITHSQIQDNGVQSPVQWKITRNRISQTFAQGTSELVEHVERTLAQSHDGRNQSVMERRCDISQAQGSVCESSNQIRALPSEVFVNGTQRWICDGASNCGCISNKPCINSHGDCASHQSRCNEQSYQQSHAVCDQCGTQNIRTSQIHKTTVVRVVPFTYTGKVWCVRVPSGAFVAERNGAYFPTGNSGFPKSHDVSKALDKQAGAEREVVGEIRKTHISTSSTNDGWVRPSHYDDDGNVKTTMQITAPATDLAKQWHGWGTAAKPAHEPAILAYKPHDTEHGIIIANLQRLEAQLWLIQFVCSAEWNSTSSLSELSAVLSIAQWTADELISTKEDLCVQMDTSQLSEVMTTCLSIVQSWKHTWEEASIAGSTFITATVLSPIIGWTTLRSSASHLTPNSITKAVMEHGTTWQRALSAALPFVVASEKLRSTLELIAVEHAISETYNPADIDKRTAVEPAVLARKPLIGTVADNVTAWGVGGLNIDGCRVGTTKDVPGSANGRMLGYSGGWSGKDASTSGNNPNIGRWPANVILDEDAGEALDEQSQSESSRFFYTAKASKAEREAGLEGMEVKQTGAMQGNVSGGRIAGDGRENPEIKPVHRANHHPTVKPIALMCYLVRLVTPKDGTVLDPFMGSGSTGCAAMCEGVNFVGIELSEEYLEIARRRIEYWQSQNPMGL